MSWIKISDTVANHPKFIGLSNDAFALWVKALGYAKHYRTDGAVPEGALRGLANHPKPSKVAQELMDARLWEATRTGYQIHDYLEHNDSREDVERKVEEAKQRKERWRNKNSGQFGAPGERVPERIQNDEGTPVSHPHDTETETETETETKYKEIDRAQGAPTLELVDEASPTKPPVQVQEVFNAYLSGWRQHVGHGAEPVLTAKRERIIKARLKEHPPDVVCRAARGIWASSWHREQSQTSIDLAMRDAAHVERFSGEPPKQAGSVMRPSRPVQRSPGYQQTEERKRAEFLAENARKQQELGLIPDEYGQVF